MGGLTLLTVTVITVGVLLRSEMIRYLEGLDSE